MAHIFVPFTLSFALAYILNPVIANFEARGLRREVTVTAFYLCAGLAAVLLAGSLLRIAAEELAGLEERLPAALEQARRLPLNWQAKLAGYWPGGAVILSRWDANASAARLFEQAQNIPGYLLGILPLLSMFFLIPFISFFLLVEGPRPIDRLIQACPSRYVEQILHLISEIDASLGNYLRGLVVIAVAIAGASYLGLLILGVDQALMIALISGISSFVPYLGAVAGASIGGLIAAFQFGSVTAGLKVVLLFLLIRLADEAFLQPFVARFSFKLHPLVLLFTFMLGGELFGFIGLIFAVPAACVIKALFQAMWSWYSSAGRLVAPQIIDEAVVPYT
ncbi:MAG: hypothetical protein A3J74_09205 [Elusimicrobia bacterium RIFCSPHIGHO2_02_FULL_57_9]|nr:MAG: hypothetical protein A3J74_09205 [Elusimicrobia bacterium RIFCSPHIGHO2_02_FULL_57_9]